MDGALSPIWIPLIMHSTNFSGQWQPRLKIHISFFKWASPGLFFIYFRPFKHKLQILQQINVKNVHSQPLEYESPHITTRPGLPPVLDQPLIRRWLHT